MVQYVVEIPANGLKFACRRSDGDRLPVLLLHGFPETSLMWEPVIQALRAEGYPSLAPDLRGYSSGARPKSVMDYSYENLIADVFELADAMGWPRFHLIAHDWGAVVGWLAVSSRPDRIQSFNALSIPHYRAFAEAVYADPEQASYRRFLEIVQAGDAAERSMSRDDFAALRQSWDGVPAHCVQQYVSVLSEPQALTSALNWYRASRGHRRILEGVDLGRGAVSTPTQLIWGRHDPYVRRSAVDLGSRYMSGSYSVMELEAGHWLVEEKTEPVIGALLDHLRANAP